MAANNILQFGTTASGGNILSQAAYSGDAQRLTGHQPGIARQELENKTLLQLSTIAAGVAQFLADNQSTDVSDTLTPAQISAMLGSAAKGRLIARRVFTTTQVYTPTAGTQFVVVTVVGGGGGGGGAQSTAAGTSAAGAGGGGGGWAVKRINSGFSGVTMTVGAGGAGGVTTNNGANGGTTSFGALVSASGGTGGPYGPQQSNGTPYTLGFANAGIGSNGDINFQGGWGGWAFYASNPQSGKGGSSYGGEGGLWKTGYATGGDATSYGGGGGGGNCPPSVGGATGGSGFQGVIIVEEYY